MSPEQEKKIGAQEHQKIIKQYGLYKDKDLQAYVSGIGARVTQKTERPDVTYKFYIIDSPIVNAFALPGGYVYVSRGLLALANSEAELAGVLGHEAAHITARHSAERYSHGVVTSLGGTILSAVLGNQAASQAIGLGSNLYLSGYSRGQENEADALGLRYMTQGGYEPEGLTAFLSALNQDKELSKKTEGTAEPFAYFSTHPPTPERILKTQNAAANYPLPNPITGRATYLKQIDGLIYGDSPEQGLVRGQSFYHTVLGFKFNAPKGYEIINQPSQVVMKSEATKALMIFDFAAGQGSASAYLNTWLKDKEITTPEALSIGTMQAATANYDGIVNGENVTIQAIAIKWDDNTFARYTIAIPKGLTSQQLDAIKTATYSFERLSTREKAAIQPNRIKIITARWGDTSESLAAKQSLEKYSLERFKLLNGLGVNKEVEAGRQYKIVVTQ